MPRFNIISVYPKSFCCSLAALLAMFGPCALGQDLGAGVESILEEDIEDQVTAEVEASVEAQIEEQVTQQTEAQVEAEVEANVEANVEASVEAGVEQQVEASVANQVEASVENQVESSVSQQIEAEVAGSVEQSIESSVEASVEGSVEAQVESGIAQSIEMAVDSSISDGVVLAIEADVGDSVGLELEAGLGEPAEVTLEVEADVTAGAAAEGQASGSDDDAASPPFVGDVDAEGNEIEADAWVVLVPAEYSDRIESWGFTIRERRDLDGLDRVLLRVDAPGDRDIVQAALELAVDAPGTVVDYNHTYEATQSRAMAVPAPSQGAVREFQPRAAAFRLGLVDTAVDATHPALSGIAIEQRDFVVFGNARGVDHGTAVASIVADAAGGSEVSAGLERLFAASVFFQDEHGVSRATTAGLISAIDWLAAVPDLDVINMSLTGPSNSLLEATVNEIAERGIRIVAAVGNGGPVGKALYPAAYPGVVGVTAVDARHGIYRYANRGPQVMFAAPGVDVPVAAPGGSYRHESGTSFAAPVVAARLAAFVAVHDCTPAEAIERLKTMAVDLGEVGYDEVFGFGLLAGRVD